MSSTPPDRRLAAILAADVVGYSKLISEDEAGTLAIMRQLRSSILEPLIAQHKGRLFKSMGDGFLVEFPSVVNAVTCAVAIQDAIATSSASRSPRLTLRIGVHLGDVVSEGDDLFGDGVNIAARLESLAPPGGVVVSAMVHDNIGNRLNLQFVDIGLQHLKNISRPVRVFQLATGPLPSIEAAHNKPAKSSIAVLPFTNMSGDAEQDYFSDGITEDIITELSRFRSVDVIARNSTFQYKGKAVDLRQLGRDLNASHVLEGSVRRMGPRIRVTAQLIETDEGRHLWAERFDRPGEEIFAIQDELVRTVVATVAGRIEASTTASLKTKTPASLSAYECVLKGYALPVGDRESLPTVMALYEEAIRLDPTYALAHARLAICYQDLWWESAMEDRQDLDKAYKLAQRAIDLDPREPVAHTAMSYVASCLGQLEMAERHAREAISLNPNRPNSIMALGDILICRGRPSESIALIKDAMQLDPHHPTWYWTQLGVAYFMNRKYHEAIDALQRRTRQTYYAQAYLAACYAYTDLTGPMNDAARLVLQLHPQFSIKRFLTKETLQRQEDRDNLEQGLRKAGLPE